MIPNDWVYRAWTEPFVKVERPTKNSMRFRITTAWDEWQRSWCESANQPNAFLARWKEKRRGPHRPR